MASQYKIYNTLNKRLLRSGFHTKGKYKKYPNRGSIATFLCELFLVRKGVVRKHDLIIHGIIKEGQTLEFLELLIKEGYITWDMESNIEANQDRYKTFASKNLSDLINKETNQQFVTQRDLEKFAKNMEKCIKKMIDHFDPPVTKEKVKSYMEWSEDWDD